MAEDQWIMGNEFLIGCARSIVEHAPITVVAAKVVIIPHINEGDLTVELGLLGRREHRIVSGSESRAAVCPDIEIMKISHVHVEQRAKLPYAIKHVARRARSST